MTVRLYLWQRATAALMVPLVLVHIAVIFYASRKGMTAADFLSGTVALGYALTTGLMLTASYTWMKGGDAYVFLAVLHAITVIFTLLWLPFGKLFHIALVQLCSSFSFPLGATLSGFRVGQAFTLRLVQGVLFN